MNRATAFTLVFMASLLAKAAPAKAAANDDYLTMSQACKQTLDTCIQAAGGVKGVHACTVQYRSCVLQAYSTHFKNAVEAEVAQADATIDADIARATGTVAGDITQFKENVQADFQACKGTLDTCIQAAGKPLAVAACNGKYRRCMVKACSTETIAALENGITQVMQGILGMIEQALAPLQDAVAQVEQNVQTDVTQFKQNVNTQFQGCKQTLDTCIKAAGDAKGVHACTMKYRPCVLNAYSTAATQTAEAGVTQAQ